MNSKSVAIKYFAIFRESAGKSHETIETTSLTAKELYLELQKRYGFRLSPENLRVAANQNFTSLDYVLNDGDQLVFIPPVAGG